MRTSSLLLLALLALATTARAEPEVAPFADSAALSPVAPSTKPVTAVPTLDAFSYVRAQDKLYLRGAFEVLTVLVVGNVDYLQNTAARGGLVRAGDRRWDLRFDTATFQSKLTGEYWQLDTNHFNTNYIAHPFAGTMYYTSARANHLSWFEAYAYTLVGSVGWEYFGELREAVSLNDVIVTSSAGLAIGETMMQFSSFFYRGRKTLRNDVLGAIFSPAKAINDWADGAEHARSADVDELGLSRDTWHRFEVFGGIGLTTQRSGTYIDTRVGMDLALVNLPGYGGAAHRSDFFNDGNRASIHLDTSVADGRLRHFVCSMSAVPFGYYAAKRTVNKTGQLTGDSAVLGMLTKFVYEVHDYDRDRLRPVDLLTRVSPLGMTVEYTHTHHAFHVRTRLDLSAEFAGVTAYALDDYRTRHQHNDANLQTVVKQKGYYHGVGMAVSPSVHLGWNGFSAGANATFESFRGVEGFDEQQASITKEVPLGDRRIEWAAWGAFKIPGTPVEFGLRAKRRLRIGEVGDVRSAASETSLDSTAGLVF